MITPDPKIKRHEDKYYTDVWLRKQACVACGDEPIEDVLDVIATHKGGGTAIKGDDREALPLCFYCHDAEHRGQKTFWRKVRRKTGMSRAFLVKLTWARYRKERKCVTVN